MSAVAAEILEHPLQLVRHFLHAGRREDFEADRQGLDFDFDLLVIESSLTQHLAKLLAGIAIGGRLAACRETDIRLRWRQQGIEHAFLRSVLGTMPDFRHGIFPNHLDRDIHQIANNAVDFAPHVADLGKLGCFDLDKRCLGQTCETARNLGLTDPGRPDHEDVLWRNLASEWFVYLYSAPAIAQGDCNGALGLILADDVFVELLNDLSWGHLGHREFPVTDRRIEASAKPLGVGMRRRLTFRQFLDHDILIGVNADISGDR